MDDPVIGQLGRANTKRDETAKVEIVGRLYPDEWKALIACIKECVRKFPTLKVREVRYPMKRARLTKAKGKGKR